MVSSANDKKINQLLYAHSAKKTLVPKTRIKLLRRDDRQRIRRDGALPAGGDEFLFGFFFFLFCSVRREFFPTIE